MTSRFDGRRIGINTTDRYRRILARKGINNLEQYFTADLQHPTVEEIKDLSLMSHIWKEGDRFFKLAHQYYGDATMWWVIAWFNRTPTESHVGLNDTIYIPQPLDLILDYYNV
jgi:nucleoid-associated protein YgaU|tara:strand:- start:50 stop:388 length:339 start_codon:yes stop_codon:yes gene_type:complete